MTAAPSRMEILAPLTAPGFPVEIVILDDTFFARVSVAAVEKPEEIASLSGDIPAQ